MPHTGKHLNFTEKEIKDYLETLKKLVLNRQYSISLNKNRQENIDFMQDYRINSSKAKEILVNLQYDDFCYAADNYKKGYEHEKLYVFCKEYELDNWGNSN